MAIFLSVLLAVLAGLSIVFYRFYRLRHLQDRGDLTASLQQEINKFTKKQRCGGVVVGAYKQGKTYLQGHGCINPDNPKTPDEKAIFQIGSVSKVFTATTLQILCDEGLLHLDDTLEQLLGKQLPLDSKVKSITLRQLATHTAGFPRVPKVFMQQLERKLGKKQQMDNPYNEFELADIYAYLQNPSDLGQVGKFAYSNYGMGLLGHILEQVSGQNLETLVTEKTFRPLQMQHSGIDLSKQPPAQIMQGYTASCEPASAWTFAVLAGAGAFYSTAEDLLRFIQANLAQNNSLLASLQKTHAAQASGKTGLGWIQATFFDRLIGTRTVVWHDGMVKGFSTYIAFDQQQECGVVVLSSRGLGMNMLGMLLMRQLATQSWNNN